MSITRSPSGLAGKLGVSFFFGVFLAMGLFFLGLMVREVAQIAVTYSWKETTATILSSSVGEKPGKDDPFSPIVSFRYQWEGRAYTSDRYAFKPKRMDDYSAVEAKISALSPGTVTVCYVNPRDPATAILRREGWGIAFFILLPLVFVVVGGGGIYGTWAAARRAKSEPLSSPKGSGLGRGGTLLFGGVFVAVGAGLLVFWFLPAAAKSLASTRWTETPCTVISSRVKSHSDSDGTTYSVDIFYRYTVNGREYKSNRYASLGGSSSGYKGKAAAVEKYPAGSQRICYVNPDDPTDVLLKPGVGWELLFGLIPTAFMAAGAGVMWASRRAPKRVTRVSGALPAASVTESGPLKSRASPLARLFGITIFAVIWNGLVGVFLWNLSDGFQRLPGVFFLIFFLPFALIGLGALAGVVYCLLALTNPRCRLQISSSVLHPGESLEVSWTLAGSVHRLQRLRIFLEGREEATYRRGTSSYTDRHVFARLSLAELSNSLEMAQGEVNRRLPGELPPSFAATSNKIIWTLKVHGEIANWPDVNEEYEITVESGIVK